MSLYSTALPPARYDHRFTGTVIERRMSLAELQHVCHGTIPGDDDTPGVYLGCSYREGMTCIIFIAKGPTADRIRRHEVGHCNGWSENHEQ